jgi:chromosome segregation ATPase
MCCCDHRVQELAVVQVSHRDAMLVSKAEAEQEKAELERKNADLLKQCAERSETIKELRQAVESMRLRLVESIAQCHWDVAAEQVTG